MYDPCSKLSSEKAAAIRKIAVGHNNQSSLSLEERLNSETQAPEPISLPDEGGRLMVAESMPIILSDGEDNV
jgi:hypothetical protein